MCPCSNGQRLGAMLWSTACSAPFFRSRMNHHHCGCQTLHPPGWEPHSLVPKLAEIGAGGITLCLWAEECPDRSCHLAGAHPVPVSSPWLQVSLRGNSSSTQSASCCRASITLVKVIKDPQWMSHSLGGSKPVCKRRSHWEKGPEEKREI